MTDTTEKAAQSYKETINVLANNIHTGLIDFSLPRSEASMPTQASSEFITNKQQGDWAEDVLLRAINTHSNEIVAVRYGKSDDRVAGDAGFESFFKDYQDELDTIGKRPDLLLFRRADFREDYGHDISKLRSEQIGDYVRKAIAGIEVRSSAFLIDKYNDEAQRFINENTETALRLRDIILKDYKDILQQKRPELVPIVEQIDEASVRTIDYRLPSWSSSQRLQELKKHLADLKKCLKNIQKRNTLSITPKAEDLKVVYKWVMTYGVPHYYAQVFFDKVYGISFEQILRLLGDPSLEDEKYFVEQDTKNQNKTTVKIPSQDGICLAKAVSEPSHHSVRKELNKGRLLFYVAFDGGEACIDKENFEKLFGCKL